MADLPPFELLVGVDRTVVNGLLDELGTPVWKATHDHSWERDRTTWEAVERALWMAAQGGTPAERKHGPPPWLATLIKRDLDQMSSSSWAGGRFLRVRLLERLGLVRLDHDATYVLAFVSGYDRADQHHDHGPTRADLLRSDPELLDGVLWQVFEFEGGGEVSLANIDRFRATSWRATFLELVGEGTLDRERVLRECLGALQRDFNHYRAAWFASTYLAFEPTPDERCAHQERYRQLLRSDVTATVTFALKLIGSVHKESRLEARETLAALTPAALSRPKGTALTAVRLADSLGRTDAGLAPQVAVVARNALGHDHADVQRAAATVLEKLGEPMTERADLLAPSVRARLGIEVVAPEVSQSQQRLRPPAAATTDDDLLERTAALLEDCGDPAELEAVLGGLATMTDTERLGSLRKRARAVVNRGPRQPSGAQWLRGHVAALVLSAEGIPEPLVLSPVAPLRFITGRFHEVRARLLGEREPAPLLAVPDADGGFVRAGTLVDRLSSLAQVPDCHDLAAALLRLHPDDRADALDRAGSLSGPVGPVVRHALGAPPQAERLGPEAWWVAAARARAPLEEDEVLMAAGLTASGQGRPFARQVARTLQSYTWSDDRGSHTGHYYQWELDPDPWPGAPQDDQPTVFSGEWQGHPQFGDWVAALAAIWPHDAEHYLAITCKDVLEAPTYASVWPDAVPVLDALAMHPGRLGPIARAVLTTGLNAAKGDQRLHAVDAFVELVGSGRIEPSALAESMASLVPGHTATRWGDSLRAAAASPAGAAASIDVLTALLPRVPVETRGLHALLDVLHEESLRHARPATDPALREWLHRVTGSSRAARSARSLLALSS